VRFGTALHASLATRATGPRSLASHPKPPALVLNEPTCYHFRALDPTVSLSRALICALAGIGDCYRI